jgi:hypothetical protein
MNFPQWLGLFLLVPGVVLQPVGWAFVRWLTPASFVLILFGVLLLVLGWREAREEKLRELARGGSGGPGDIHGYSGQFSGGRSTAYEAPLTTLDGDGD